MHLQFVQIKICFFENCIKKYIHSELAVELFLHPSGFAALQCPEDQGSAHTVSADHIAIPCSVSLVVEETNP